MLNNSTTNASQMVSITLWMALCGSASVWCVSMGVVCMHMACICTSACGVWIVQQHTLHIFSLNCKCAFNIYTKMCYHTRHKLLV